MTVSLTGSPSSAPDLLLRAVSFHVSPSGGKGCGSRGLLVTLPCNPRVAVAASVSCILQAADHFILMCLSTWCLVGLKLWWRRGMQLTGSPQASMAHGSI